MVFLMNESKEIEFLDLISGNFKSPLDDWEQEVFSILKSEERNDREASEIKTVRQAIDYMELHGK